MSTDLTIYEPYLIYWANQVLNIPGFIAGQEAEIKNDYFMINPMMLTRLSRTFDWYDKINETYHRVYPANWRLRITAYGNKCDQNLIKLENSLYDNIWNYYLKTKNLNFANCTDIRISTDYSITQFLKQAQFDIVFNIVVSEDVVPNWIDIVSGGLIVNENNNIIINNTIQVDNS